MSAQAIIAAAQARSIQLYVENNQLKTLAKRGAMTDELRQQIKQHKNEIIACLLSAEATAEQTKASAGQWYALSFAQQRLWFIDQLEGGSSQYNIPLQFQLRGALNVAALKQALRAIVQRHEVLRTEFREHEGTVYQRPRADFDWRLEQHDLSQLPTAERDAETQKIASADARADFDLNHDVLLRAQLLRLADDHHVLLINVHHIAADGWSMGVLFSELDALYRACCDGQPSPLPELNIQYADYAHWQRDWLSGEVLEQQLNYWRDQLAGAPPVHHLPLDQPRPPEQQFTGAVRARTLDESLLAALQALCQRCDVTLFMLLQTAFAVLISRYSNEADVVMGTPVAGRAHADTEGLIGFFINTLPLRTRIDHDLSFAALLQANKQTIVDAYSHQQLPFEMLVEALQPERNLRYNPITQILFALQNNQRGERRLGEIELQPLRTSHNIIKFDLELLIGEQASDDQQQLLFNWNYNTALFHASSIDNLAASYETLLRAIVADADTAIARLPLLDQDQRQAVLAQSARREVFAAGGPCLHQLFEQQARQQPQAPAVTFETRTLSYAELNQKANQLAHYLRGLGVDRDSLVGLCVERGVDMIVAILGIMKAGGAYVPIDPQLPDERIQYIINDSGIEWLLGEEDQLRGLSVPSLTTVALDQLDASGQLAQQDDSDPDSEALGFSDTQLAYVIYTSGSTGQPKGVLIEHGNVSRLLLAAERQFSFSAADVWTLFHSFTFDFSVWELWGALAYGGRLVVVPYWISRSTSDFYDLLQTQQVTVLNQTPSAFIRLIEVDQQRQAALALRYVVFGGEALNVSALKPWFDRHGEQTPTLVNMYGITETTVHVTHQVIDRQALRHTASNSPIGRPLSDLSVYVLDPQQQLCPLGVAGELYVGGAGLARAYLGREALTAERFIATTDAEWPEQRLYRTGDVGRWLADGSLEYIGRIDNQVKIRGFRIELGEIEHQLAACTGVKDVLVIVRQQVQDDGDQQRLVAYLAASDAATTPEALIEHCRAELTARLPAYMVPAAFVVLDSLPLTANGKVDREQLPEPDWQRFQRQYQAPRSAVERALAAIYEELLPVAQVGIDDSFFALGGDSISTIQLVAKARQQGLKLEVREVFRHQTVRALSPLVETLTATQAQQSLVSGAVALTPVQHWFIDKAFCQPQQWNQAMLYQLPATLDEAALQTALNALVSHHDALRLQYPGGDWQAQTIAAEVQPAPLRTVDLRQLQGAVQSAEMKRIADQEQASLSLDSGLLLRACCFQLADDDQRLLLVIHHLAVDGVSWRILQQDLRLAYQQAAAGEALMLPPKTHSFRDWSAHLQEHATSAALMAEVDYWREQVAQVVPLHHEGDGANLIRHSRVQRQPLSASLTEQLLQAPQRIYNTQINDVLLSALLLAYQRWCGNNSVSLHLEGHGREPFDDSLDLSRTVGWFTSIYPLTLSRDDGGSDVGRLLMRVKEQLRAIPNKGIGYGLLRYLHPDPEVRAALQPAMPVALSFNYLGQFQGGGDSAAFDLSDGDTGSKFAADQECVDRLSIMASIYQGQLRVACQYSSECYGDERIQQLLNEYLNALSEIIEHCRQARRVGRTPSDYEQCRLSQDELDRLRAALGDHNGDALAAVYPLSAVQQGMLHHSRLEAGVGHYVVQIGLDLAALDAAALQRAWQQLLDSHPILRTQFPDLDSAAPHQVVPVAATMPWQSLDWSELSAEEQQQRWSELMQQDREQGFNAGDGPLMRATLITLGPDRHRLLWSHHHALLDGWSLPLLFRDLQRVYSAQVRKVAIALQPPAQFVDYIAWLQQQDASQARDFWRSQLADISAPTALNFGLTSRPRESGEQVQVATKLDSTALARLQTLAQQHQLTLSTLLQGVWGLLLSRYSGDHSVVFGATVSGRPPELAGVDEILGPFINTLPARVDIAGGQSLLDYLQQLQDAHLLRERHGYLPLVEIQQCSGVIAGQPLFESLVVFENYPNGRIADQHADDDSARLRITATHNREQTHYPLTLSLATARGHLAIRAFYDSSRFQIAAIKRLLGHYRHLLQQFSDALAGDQSITLARLRLVDQAECEQLQRWNQAQPLPSAAKLQQRFEQQAQLTPQAPAVVAGDQRLSYAELEARANQLAHYLRSRGVIAEQRVGICLQREPLLLVALLSVLKAGGVYVPLDPEYPQQRLADTVADAGLKLLLTTSEVAAAGELGVAAENRIDLCSLMTSEWPVTPPDVVIDSDSLAYLIYTSGSTGRPKGVAIRHGSASAMLAWAVTEFGEALRGVLASTSICFDLSVYELFAPLSMGGQVVLAKDALSLLDFHNWSPVTLINTVPSAMAALVEQQALPDHVQVVNLAGEALSRETVDKVHACSQIVHLYNLYGPSEDTTYSTGGVVPAATAAKPTIGRPLPNTRAWVLDQHLQATPLEVAGELYLSGVGLARGYLNQPGLTAERFVPNPQASEPGERMYRTGDLCRWLSGGELDYLGRVDHQVKLHGFRIEPGEIESRLRQLDAVDEAVAQVLDGELGQQLVAYVTAAETVDEALLKRHLQSVLPAYMVPLAIVQLSAMPLTANGKIDRQALPAPDWEQYRRRYVAPRTALESSLVGFYQQLLQLDQVGIDDHFFELGGHSLLVTRLQSLIRQRLQIELPLRALFEQPSVRQLAAVCELHREHMVLPDIKPADHDQPLLLSYAQQRLWFIDRLGGGSAQYNMLLSYRLDGPLQHSSLEQAVNALVARHEVLRTHFGETNGEPYLVIDQQPPSAVNYEDWSALDATVQQQRLQVQINSEAQRSFDLSRDLMLRVQLIKLAEQQHALLCTLHHIASDGWSMSLFFNELSVLYAACVQGQSQPLPALPVQYADYAQWQRQWLRDQVLQLQLDYWREQLADSPPVHNLPLDQPRSPQQSFQGRIHQQRFSAQQLQRLQHCCQQHDVTLFMLTQTAFAVLLSRYSNETDIVIGSACAGRPHSDTEALIGFFINMLPLRTRLDEDATFASLLATNRQTILDAFSHQHVPFEMLVEELQPERNPQHSPLFQISFSLQNENQRTLQLADLSAQPIGREQSIIKFDLELFISEQDQQLQLNWNYNTALFEAATIERLAASYAELLQGIVADVHQPIAKLPLLPAAQREQLTQWNNTTSPLPAGSVAAQFEQQVELRPEQTAVIIDGEPLSYIELNRQANQLATVLRGQGVGLESRVGVCLGRGPWLLPSLLAIWKAGGAYVPLDPAYPSERLNFMIADAGIELVLTVGAGPDDLNARTLDLNSVDLSADNHADSNPSIPVAGASLAYVIYTSGSTGRPKGVMVSHRNILRLLIGTDFMTLDDSVRMLQAAPVAFDASTLELWAPLIHGAVCVLYPGDTPTAAQLASVIREQQISHAWLTAALFNTLVDESASSLSGLKQLAVGGEAVSAAHVKRLYQLDDQVQLINGYGPTESTTFACCHPIPRDLDEHASVAIGGPICNTQAYVLDSQLQALPIGVIGELYLGGEGLARGYLDRPGLTAERFVPSPFATGERLYRTGDLCRWRADGAVDYVGRLDDQIKLRGFRIELGEVESRLQEQCGVQAAVAQVVDGELGQQLVGYVVVDGDFDENALKAGLQSSLPGYMVPLAIIELNSLPLTANGKLDRSRLPAPDWSAYHREYVAPRDATEEQLAAMFTALLPVEQVGIDDNFFELGGHSLLATRLISRVRQELELELPLRLLFERPTVRQLREVIDSLRYQQRAQENIARIAESDDSERVVL